jgi:hypothetical protein
MARAHNARNKIEPMTNNVNPYFFILQIYDKMIKDETKSAVLLVLISVLFVLICLII